MQEDAPKRKFVWIKLADQFSLAFVVLLSLLIIGGYWISGLKRQGGWVEIDKAPKQSAEFRVDVNKAEWPELALLPGLGESLARRVVEYRNENGPFRNVEQLAEVRGIGASKLEKIRPYLLPISPSSSIAAKD